MQKKGLLLFLMLFIFILSGFPGKGMGAETVLRKKMNTETAAKKKPEGEPASSKVPAAHPASGKAPVSGELTPGQVNARSAILMEVSTGKVLFEQNADEVIEPASFTKVLSLYLIFEALQQGRIHLNDEVYISDTAWRTGGSKMFVGVGSRIPLEELIKGITVVSGNDACVAAAEHAYGSVDTFVDAMNRKAAELGMRQSRFMNPHGLPAEGQVTTARDMATLGSTYLQRFPESLRFHSIREYTFNNILQYNRNHLLLKDPSVDGLKTGFVAAAGYHLSATAQRDGMRLLGVVMGATTPAVREREAMKLINFGFRQYTMVQPFSQGQPVATLKVWKGEKDELSLYPAETASFLIPQSQKNLLRWEIHAGPEVTAPVRAQQSLGEVVFYVSDQAQKSVSLVSLEEVTRAGWIKRSWQSLLRIQTIDWRWFGGIAGGILLVGMLVALISGRRRSSSRSRRSRSLSG